MRERLNSNSRREGGREGGPALPEVLYKLCQRLIYASDSLSFNASDSPRSCTRKELLSVK